MCLTGAAGSGKSAVFAQLHRALATDPSVLLLAHAAGVSPRGGAVDALLRRWIGGLAAVLGTTPELPETAPNEDVEKTFHEHLGRVAAQRRVVLLVDALNQIERTPRGTHVTWLPKLFPPNARLIATTIPGSESEALDERSGMELAPLGPLSVAEMRQIAAAVCGRYHSPVRPAVVETLLAQQLPGVPWAQAFATLIAVSRAGWREADLRVLVPAVAALFGPVDARRAWSYLELAALRRAFRGQLVRRGTLSQWDFAHQQMRVSVAQRDLGDAATARRVHAAFAAHLLALTRDDPLHESETMVHLIGADDRVGAARCYGGALSAGELVGATAAHVLETEAPVGGDGVAWVTALLEQDASTNDERAVLANRLIFDLHDRSTNARLDTLSALLPGARAGLERLAAADPTNAGWQRDLWVSYWKMADMAERSGAGGDMAWWRKAYKTLSGMNRRGLFISPQDEQFLAQLRAKVGGAPSDAVGDLPQGAAGVPLPHPGADPNRAVQLHLEYQRQLAAWQALPLWKRWRTKKPEPPAGT